MASPFLPRHRQTMSGFKCGQDHNTLHTCMVYMHAIRQEEYDFTKCFSFLHSLPKDYTHHFLIDGPSLNIQCHCMSYSA
jgi:hypothetical protein